MQHQRFARLAAILLLCGAAAPTAPPAADLYGALRWRALGPFRGGWATMVAGVPSRPDRFFFAAAGGGLWRSDNAGRSWASLFDHGPAAAVGAVAIAPSAPDTIYIGTGQPEPRYDVAAGQGVFRSTDGGAHWTSLGLADTKYIGSIWVSPTNPDTVLVGAQGHFFGPSKARGIYRSTDGGRNWTQPLAINDRTGIVDIASDPADPSLLIASAWQAVQYPWQSYFTDITGPGSGLYRSTDGGASWARLGGAGWPAGPLGRIGIAVAHTAAGTRIYAAVDAGKTGKTGGLYRSDDGGGDWRRVNAGDAFTGWYASRLTVAPNDPDVIYTVGQSIRRCDQGGAHCTIIKGAPGGDDYHHIWINPAHPDHLITGSDQGAVVSVDGGASWSSWYNQPTGQFYHLAADNRFPYWIYSGQQDSGTVGIASRSDYGSLSFRDWHPVGGDERDDDIPDPADPLIVYGSGLGGHITRWNGHTGQVQDISPWPVPSYGKRPTLTRYHYLWVTPLVASATGPAALYLGAQVLFRTADGGRHWAIISGDLTGKQPGAKECDGDVSVAAARPCGYGSIATIAPSPRHAGEIWVGTDDGLVQVSHDGGASWSDVTPTGTPAWAKIVGLEPSPQTDGTVYAVIDGQRLDDFAPHILRSRDSGHSWQTIVAGLPDGHVAAVIRADPQRAGLLYAGTDAGVFVSFDDGDHWQSLQQNFPTAWVRDLLVHGNDLIAATQGRAIWVLDDLSPLRQASADTARQPAFLFAPAPALRVHPNNNADTPLPPQTPVGENPPGGAVIDYWLGAPTTGPVVLTITDAAGHVVRRFDSATPAVTPDAERYFAQGWTRPPAALPATPGMHRFVWDLHTERPAAIHYGYGIAAVWGRDTPVSPLGPYVLPGNYRVQLTAGGHSQTVTLAVGEDPRITTSPADLAASFALSQRIDAALASARQGYGEIRAVQAQLAALAPVIQHRSPPADPAPDQLRATADFLATPAAPDAPEFDSIDETLGAIESALEAVDAAPTAAQAQVVSQYGAHLADAWRRWSDFKTGRLAALNAVLARAGKRVIVIPPPDRLPPTAPDSGQDLP